MQRLAACALAGLLCHDAMALTTTTPPPQIELDLSGSTAQDEALENLIRLSICRGRFALL